MGTQAVLESAVESHDTVTVTIKKPSTRYVDEFLLSKCAPDLIATGIYPNTKEITESAGAYNAVRKYLWDKDLDRRRSIILRPESPHITGVFVGDGRSPRTGAMFAYRTRWDCISVDPQLKQKDSYREIQRLRVVTSKIEDFPSQGISLEDRSVVLVAVHSHADLTKAVQVVEEMGAYIMGIVAIPCCTPQNLDQYYLEGLYSEVAYYQDWGIWSPQRTVKVWKEDSF